MLINALSFLDPIATKFEVTSQFRFLIYFYVCDLSLHTVLTRIKYIIFDVLLLLNVYCGPLWSVVVRCGPVVVRCGPLW